MISRVCLLRVLDILDTFQLLTITNVTSIVLPGLQMQVLSDEHDLVLAGAGLNQSLLPSGLPALKKQKGGTASTSLVGTS